MKITRIHIGITLLGILGLLLLFQILAPRKVSSGKRYNGGTLPPTLVEMIDLSSSHISGLQPYIEMDAIEDLSGSLSVIAKVDNISTMMIIDFNKDLVINVKSSFEPSSLDWCSNSQVVVASLKGDIHMIDTANGTSSLLYHADTPNAAANNVRCSPDGTQVAFYSRKAGRSAIYILNVLSRKVVQYSDGTHAEYSPSWSPDGSKIVYSSVVDGESVFSSRPKVSLIESDLASAEKKVLYTGVLVANPEWSQDNLIAFNAIDELNGVSHLYMLNVGSNKIEKVAEDIFNYHFEEEAFFTWSRTPKLAMFLADAGSGYEIYLLNFETKSTGVVLQDVYEFIGLDWN